MNQTNHFISMDLDQRRIQSIYADLDSSRSMTAQQKNRITFIKNKNEKLQEIIQNTIFSIQNNKISEIHSKSELNNSISILIDCFCKTQNISEKLLGAEEDFLLDLLQEVIDKVSIVICNFGTYHFQDLMFISFDSQFIQENHENLLLQYKRNLIFKHIHPVGYKSIPWKKSMNINDVLCCDKITDELLTIENSSNFECFDVDLVSTKQFLHKVYGIRIVLQNNKTKKTVIVNGIIDDIPIDCLSNEYIHYRKQNIQKYICDKYVVDTEILLRIVESMSLKDILIYSNEDIYKKYKTILFEIDFIRQNKIHMVIKKFTESDLYNQREQLIHLFLYNKNPEIQYTSYLLYDLLSNDLQPTVDSNEQNMIYKSLPWKIKLYFKDIMKTTVHYTQDMMNKYDTNKVSFEQQIFLMKVPEYVKEKAMIKFKEIKGKTDDTSTKAKQYLDGLLKIPFGVFKEEPILKIIKENNNNFSEIVGRIQQKYKMDFDVVKKPKYTTAEMLKYIKTIESQFLEKQKNDIQHMIRNQSIKHMNSVLQYILNNNKDVDFSGYLHLFKNKSKDSSQKIISAFVALSKEPNHINAIYDKLKTNDTTVTYYSLTDIISDNSKLKTNSFAVEKYVKDMNNVLDSSIYGHEHAKNQILKIIAQWMNGEQRGYCFGFEGSPGVGKTSLAKKGLSHCLIDDTGTPRPFSFIALGGSSNGSTFEGHSYTYVNSTWGRIVDILMETKCMNPIIYIDELDKVSKTEHGKEIIGILTHLIDSTQNDVFQDKYFSGINIDLSKVLFIFSYNNPDEIDSILLDRIHRIRFDNLSVEDKITIVNNYILPEINSKMGFSETVSIDIELIEYIIETYTLEPGVRKLKEVLFDLYGEINVSLLKGCEENIQFPIIIHKNDLENKYLKKYQKIEETKVHKEPQIGIINGLWANALGKGGIIPIESMFFPSSQFLELKLTGLQGDVMKESMNVAKSLAWSLTPDKQKTKLLKWFEETKCQGLHIHCPQGAVSKDGPSAGTAITIVMYSLFNKIPIRNTVAITGEINLQGQITAIGGLESKILGGIRAGVKTFLYPKPNRREFQEFMSKYSEKPFLANIEFIEIYTISDVINYVFE
jgi:hypothetical protein